MTEHTTERELKLAVPDETTLEKLEALFGGEADRVLLQKNTFFDFERRLTDKRWSLRLRIQNGDGLLNLKGPKTSGDALLVSRPETPDVAVSEDVARALLAGNDDALEHLDQGLREQAASAYVQTARTILDGERATPFASFENERRTYLITRAGLSLEIEADRSDFGEHGRYFEIELELPAGARAKQHADVQSWLEDQFKTLEIPIVGSPSKQKRLLGFLAT